MKDALKVQNVQIHILTRKAIQMYQNHIILWNRTMANLDKSYYIVMPLPMVMKTTKHCLHIERLGSRILMWKIWLICQKVRRVSMSVLSMFAPRKVSNVSLNTTPKLLTVLLYMSLISRDHQSHPQRNIMSSFSRNLQGDRKDQRTSKKHYLHRTCWAQL